MMTFLNGLLFVLEASLVVSACAMIAIMVDMLLYFLRQRFSGRSFKSKGRHSPKGVALEKKRQLLKEKEAAAAEGYFEESYVRTFDANGATIHQVVLVPTPKALEYWREMDRLVDDQIFTNTEEI